MKANDLRIGNWVESVFFTDTSCEKKEKRPIQVKHGDIYGFASGDLKLYPIPLNEEWLLKFGFEKGDGLFRYGLDGTSDIMISPLGDVLIKEYVVKCFIPLCTKLKYVHQLQNLYFALTGQEL